MRDLTIVFHDAGGGHRNAALALKTVLEEQDDPWNVRLLNIQELLDPIDLVHKATGHRLQDGYNLLLRKGWTRLTPQLLVLLQCTIRLHQPRIVRILRNFWREESYRSRAVRNPTFQCLPGREHPKGGSQYGVCYRADGPGRLSTEFLDRAQLGIRCMR